MMIIVDGYEIGPVSTGAGRVIHNLLMELSALVPHEFLVLTRRDVPGYAGITNIHTRVIPYAGGYFCWQNRILMGQLRKTRWDLFLAPNYTLPVRFKGPSILLEHDISFVAHPSWFSRKDALKRKFLTAQSLKKASLVMTVSHFSRNEILSHFPVNPEKVQVSYHGVADTFRPAASDGVRKWKKEKGFGGEKIIGFLGSIFNRRHIPLLVAAVEKIREKIPAALYVVGKDLTRPPQNIPALLDRPWIRWDPELDDRELSFFYSALDVFAYLSEYEGFGLPPMEALACGTLPVLLNRTALAEIYPDIAVMVNDIRTTPVAEALISAITDDKLLREKMNHFLEQKHKFTWKKAAEEWAVRIESLLGD
jgi:glycosyltransferase involved in cell wall biosynthesis